MKKIISIVLFLLISFATLAGPTINTKSDAKRAITALEVKGQQVLLGSTAEGVNTILAGLAAKEWDGLVDADAPKHVKNRAVYKNETPQVSKTKLENKLTRITRKFGRLEKLRFDAFTDINALPSTATPAEIQAVYNIHHALIIAAYETDPDSSKTAAAKFKK